MESGDDLSEEEEEEASYSQYDELGRTPPRTQLFRSLTNISPVFNIGLVDSYGLLIDC